MKPPSSYDLFASRVARDKALDAVARAKFMRDALLYIANLTPGLKVIGETIARGAEAKGIIPHHPNAWGSAINTAKKRALLIETGEYGQMTKKRSHARRTPIYWVRRKR